ncbi:hypothetical protein [Haladaptatus sp. NG-WS-4]
MTEISKNSFERDVERGIRYAIIAVFLEGVRRWNLSVVVNAATAFVATFFPDVVERRYGVEFRPWQRIYTETAMFTHAFGMLGPYDDIWWWDHLTHTHSATILGGFVYAASHRRGHDPSPRVFGVVVVAGVLWEVMEYVIHAVAKRVGLEPLLVPYGRSDTLLDILFDLGGALLVIAFGGGLLRNLTHPID